MDAFDTTVCKALPRSSEHQIHIRIDARQVSVRWMVRCPTGTEQKELFKTAFNFTIEKPLV